MLTHLRVQNLKSVADSGLLELPPLTFFMGPNSSGKSTLLQAILIARQTVDSRDLQNPLVVDGDYVKLGSYREFVHRHERGRRLAVEFGLAVDAVPPLPPSFGRPQIKQLRVSAEFSYNQKTFQIFPTTVSYTTQPDRYEFTKKRLTPRDSTMDFGRGEEPPVRIRGPSAAKFYDLSSRVPYLRPRSGTPATRLSRTSRKGQLDQDTLWFLSYFVTQVFERQFKRTFYVGPLRRSPERTYLAAGETPEGVGLQGESTFAILWAARWNRRLRESVFRPANEWLKSFNIAARLELKRIGGSYFTLLVMDPVLSVQSNFADIGFGASQLLPTIVETLYAPPGSTIVMEQPEIHLHPAAQATLGDLFVHQAKQGKQLIIETHSEHLVSRVLRRIGEGTFSPHDVAIYYCQPTEEGTRVQRITIDEFGRFGEGLPAGFFEQGYTESMEHIKAVAQRSKK